MIFAIKILLLGRQIGNWISSHQVLKLRKLPDEYRSRQKLLCEEDYYGTEYWLLRYAALEKILSSQGFIYFHRMMRL